MARTADRTTIATYAAAQLVSADSIIVQHQGGIAACSCGRAHPCPIAASVRARRDHFALVLTLLDKTRELPRLQPATGASHTGMTWQPVWKITRMIKRIFTKTRDAAVG